MDPEFKFGVFDTETWDIISTGKKSVYLAGACQVVYREDNDNPINDLFDEYKNTNVRRVWAETEGDVITHDEYHDYGVMDKIVVINGQSIQWNRSFEKHPNYNPMFNQPVCYVMERGNRIPCMGVNIKGPSLCIYNPNRHPMGMSIWMETNAELELIR